MCVGVGDGVVISVADHQPTACSKGGRGGRVVDGHQRAAEGSGGQRVVVGRVCAPEGP